MVFSPYFLSLSHAKGRVSMKQWATREIGTRGLGEYMYLCKSGRGLHSVSSKTSLLRWSPRQSVCLRDACFEVFVCSVWIWFWIESHYPPLFKQMTLPYIRIKLVGPSMTHLWPLKYSLHDTSFANFVRKYQMSTIQNRQNNSLVCFHSKVEIKNVQSKKLYLCIYAFCSSLKYNR